MESIILMTYCGFEAKNEQKIGLEMPDFDPDF